MKTRRSLRPCTPGCPWKGRRGRQGAGGGARADRYQSMDEMLADLRELRSTGGTSRRSLAAAPRTRLFRGRSLCCRSSISARREIRRYSARRDGQELISALSRIPGSTWRRNLAFAIQREGTGRPQHRAAAAGDTRARRKRAQVRRAFAGHGAADCGEGRISALDPTLTAISPTCSRFRTTSPVRW